MEEEKRGELLQTMGRLNSIGCVLLLPWGLLYIGGGGRHQPLLQGRGGGWAKEEGCTPRVALGGHAASLGPSPMRMGLLAQLGGSCLLHGLFPPERPN